MRMPSLPFIYGSGRITCVITSTKHGAWDEAHDQSYPLCTKYLFALLRPLACELLYKAPLDSAAFRSPVSTSSFTRLSFRFPRISSSAVSQICSL